MKDKDIRQRMIEKENNVDVTIHQDLTNQNNLMNYVIKDNYIDHANKPNYIVNLNKFFDRYQTPKLIDKLQEDKRHRSDLFNTILLILLGMGYCMF